MACGKPKCRILFDRKPKHSKSLVTTASLARGGCAEVGVTASAKSAPAKQDGPGKLAIARLVVSRKLDG